MSEPGLELTDHGGVSASAVNCEALKCYPEHKQLAGLEGWVATARLLQMICAARCEAVLQPPVRIQGCSPGPSHSSPMDSSLRNHCVASYCSWVFWLNRPLTRLGSSSSCCAQEHRRCVQFMTKARQAPDRAQPAAVRACRARHPATAVAPCPPPCSAAPCRVLSSPPWRMRAHHAPYASSAGSHRASSFAAR